MKKLNTALLEAKKKNIISKKQYDYIVKNGTKPQMPLILFEEIFNEAKKFAKLKDLNITFERVKFKIELYWDFNYIAIGKIKPINQKTNFWANLAIENDYHLDAVEDFVCKKCQLYLELEKKLKSFVRKMEKLENQYDFECYESIYKRLMK